MEDGCITGLQVFSWSLLHEHYRIVPRSTFLLIFTPMGHHLYWISVSMHLLVTLEMCIHWFDLPVFTPPRKGFFIRNGSSWVCYNVGYMGSPNRMLVFLELTWARTLNSIDGGFCFFSASASSTCFVRFVLVPFFLSFSATTSTIKAVFTSDALYRCDPLTQIAAGNWLVWWLVESGWLRFGMTNALRVFDFRQVSSSADQLLGGLGN